jgi:hypothetical protein
VDEIEGLTALHRVPGYVWCTKHNEVHHLHAPCHRPEDHSYMYWDAERNVDVGHPTSDEDPGSFVPESGLTPGGSCRVPSESVPMKMVIRRHTPSTRAVWRSKLLDVLPEDMLDEDKERIADDLIDRAIEMGNELRRKRLVDKLMEQADYVCRYNEGPPDLYSDAADLMRDAAEEIRSMLP